MAITDTTLEAQQVLIHFYGQMPLEKKLHLVFTIGARYDNDRAIQVGSTEAA